MTDKNKHIESTDFESILSCSMKMFNAFQWKCFNLADTRNITLILFFKCDVTKFRIPPALFTQCHTSSNPSAPLTCDRNLWMPPKTKAKNIKMTLILKIS